MFPNRPDVLTPGRYIFMPKGAPHYPYMHNLWSADWTFDREDYTPFTGLGEIRPQRGGYTKGTHSGSYPLPVIVGTRNCLQSGDSYPDAPVSLWAGFNLRCYAPGSLPPVNIRADGGQLQNGILIPAPVYPFNPTYQYAAGGHWRNGSGYRYYFQSGIGGQLAAGGSWREEATGGQLADGEAAFLSSLPWEATGGQLADGGAVFRLGGALLADGGQLADGEALQPSGGALEASGGQQEGGVADQPSLPVFEAEGGEDRDGEADQHGTIPP